MPQKCIPSNPVHCHLFSKTDWSDMPHASLWTPKETTVEVKQLIDESLPVAVSNQVQLVGV